MIENTHDAGFAMRGHRYRMKPMLMNALEFPYLTYHVIRQALGNKVRNHHRVGIRPLPSIHPFNDGAKTAGDIRTAAKALA